MTPLNSLRSSFKTSRVKPMLWGLRDIVPVKVLFRMRSRRLAGGRAEPPWHPAPAGGLQARHTTVARGASWGGTDHRLEGIRGNTSEARVAPAGHQEGSPSPSRTWARRVQRRLCESVGGTADCYGCCAERFEVPSKIRTTT